MILSIYSYRITTAICYEIFALYSVYIPCIYYTIFQPRKQETICDFFVNFSFFYGRIPVAGVACIASCRTSAAVFASLVKGRGTARRVVEGFLRGLTCMKSCHTLAALNFTLYITNIRSTDNRLPPTLL